MAELSKDAMQLANKQAGKLALLSGILLLVAGVTGAAAWTTIRQFVTDRFGSNIAFEYAFASLVLTASFGGLLVIFGGILFFEDKVWTAKFFILIGVGMGFVGVVITLVIAASAENPLSFSPSVGLGFVGIVLSVIARAKSEKLEN